MSATHRSLARLPVDLFTDLISRPEDEPKDPEAIRNQLCFKLKQMNFGARGGATSQSVTTVGELLKLSPPALLCAVDPLLIHEECEELVRRVCNLCTPAPATALALFQATVETSNVPVETEASASACNKNRYDSSKPMRHLPSGMPSLDSCLRGGFRIGTITELVGRAGVGKTQLALQLCVMAARYGQGGVYIDTEKKISLRRLKEIAQQRAAAFNPSTTGFIPPYAEEGGFCYDGIDEDAFNPALQEESQNEQTAIQAGYKSSRDVLENVTVHSPSSTLDLLSVVGGIEEEILIRNQEAQEFMLSNGATNKKFPVGLIILDSIAAPTRREFGGESAPQRVSALFQIAQKLKRLADQLQVAVVVINQVGLLGDNIGTNGRANNGGSDLVAVSAALGTSWHHCISTRLLLEHERDPHRLNTTLDEAHDMTVEQSTCSQIGGNDAWKFARGHIRTATVVKSNVTGLSSMSYEVTAVGLSEIHDKSNSDEFLG